MSNDFLMAQVKRAQILLLDRAIAHIRDSEPISAVRILEGMKANDLAVIASLEQATTVQTPSTKHPAGTPIETIVEGLALRVMLCTGHQVALETTADKVSALINVLTENGYCKPTAEYQPTSNTWIVGAQLWTKSRS